MAIMKRIVSVCAAALIGLSAASGVLNPSFPVDAASSDLIVNDTFWKDTSGKNIYSQGGGIYKFGDTYYWYGVHYSGAETYASTLKKNNDWGFVSVSCYSSKDLVNWKFENDVLTAKSKGFNWCYWFGRMGVAYCQKTKKYVLIAQHNEDVMFAQSSSPTGKFEVKNYQNQLPGVLKAGTGDQTVFTDDDGQSYIICSNKGGRGHQYVVPLADDYLSAEQAVEVAKGSGREGNCMFKYKGKYYFCASDLHGYNSSHTYYMVSDKLTGPYSSWSVMADTDMDFSHVTQTGFFYTIKGSKQETVLYCGDRWSDFAGNGIGYNQWVPLSFNGSTPYFNSVSEFHLNDDTGEWRVGENNNYVLNPTFEADRVSQTTLAGWKFTGTGNSNKKGGHTGNWSAQQYDANAYKAQMSQDISLPNGTYTLKCWVKSTGGQKTAKVYVTSAGKEQNAAINSKINDWKEITISNIYVTDGKCQVGVYSDANAGNYVIVDDFTLIGKASGQQTTEPVTEYVPQPMNGKLIQNAKVADAENATDWSIQNGISNGTVVFGDRECQFTSVPSFLGQAEWLRTACDSKLFSGDQVSFSVSEDASIYVGVDSRLNENPVSWLSSWTKTKDTMTDNGDPNVTYELYSKNVKKGETVTIGQNGVSKSVNYVIAAIPYQETASTEPATDPAQTDQTPAIVYSGEIDRSKENKFLRGDLTFDGRLDVFDLCLMKRGLIGGFDSLMSSIADVNCDGTTDVADVRLLQDFLLAKKVTFPDIWYILPAEDQPQSEVQPAPNGARLMEYLDRGVSAVSTGDAVFVSWRSLADDEAGTAFNVYRTTDGKTVKVNDTPLTDGTNFTDKSADLSKANTYAVKAVVNGKEYATDGNDTLSANSAAQVRTLDIKAGGKIHFVWVGDFDGDGAYDYLVDRNADEHQKLEAYRSNGDYMWTIDLGYNSENKNNISPGPSAIDVGMWDGATVYDMDCDGYADVCLRIADGVTFGDGTKYQNSNTTAQEIAVIDGRTGTLKASAPVPQDYIAQGAMPCMMEIGYLDGVHPSVVCWMKNRNADKTFNTVTAAYGYESGTFKMHWRYLNEKLFPERTEYKNGYAEAHQIRVADIDYDGKDEVLHMGYCLNGDGTLRYHIDEIVHGDRWFVGSFENANNQKMMMGYGVQQNNIYGLLEYYYNASTGEMLWTNYAEEGTADVGRGNIGDIDPRYDGFECWSFQGLYNHSGERIGDSAMYPSIRLWWDGDLLAESYNDGKIEKWNWQNSTTDRVATTWKLTDCVGSDRGAPMFYADIMGDWREEVIMTSSDYSKLVILCPTAETDIRLYCLAQNPCYRNCMTAKGYFQSHMLDYYLGTDMEMPTAPNITTIAK